MNEELRIKNKTKTLGIDYGRAKIGLAVAVGGLSEPYRVIRYAEKDKLLGELKNVVEAEEIEKIVVGISEGEMGKESKNFASLISSFLSPISVDMFDETLTSQDAQRLSREAGMSQKKRREMEDAFAASIMLQNYLDSTQ